MDDKTVVSEDEIERHVVGELPLREYAWRCSKHGIFKTMQPYPKSVTCPYDDEEMLRVE